MVLTPLSLKARQILLRQKLPSYGEHLHSVERLLRDKEFDSLIESNFDESAPILDLCYDSEIRNSALEAYIRCVYRPYELLSMSTSRIPKTGTPLVLFKFKASPSDAVEIAGGVRAVDSFEGLRRRPATGSIPLENDESVIRVGAITMFDSITELESESFLHITELVREETLKLKKTSSSSTLLPNVVHVILPSNAFENSHETSTANTIRGSLRPYTSELNSALVRRVTCAIVSKNRGDRPLIMSFPNRLRFGEDPIVRHIEPSLAFHLQLERLSNFDIHARPVSTSSNSSSAMVHVYEAHPRKDPLAKSRFFVRALIRKMDRIGSNLNFDSYPGAETSFVEALNALEGPMAEGETKSFGSNHIFLHALPKVRDVFE